MNTDVVVIRLNHYTTGKCCVCQQQQFKQHLNSFHTACWMNGSRHSFPTLDKSLHFSNFPLIQLLYQLYSAVVTRVLSLQIRFNLLHNNLLSQSDTTLLMSSWEIVHVFYPCHGETSGCDKPCVMLTLTCMFNILEDLLINSTLIWSSLYPQTSNCYWGRIAH